MQKLFYEPEGAWFGDCMPFYHDGIFYVYHQRDTRDPKPFEPFEWSLATTKDFVHYEDKGVAIPKEGEDDPEQYIFAGSVFEGEGKFHAIYTAFNRNYAAQGKPSQVLMSAVSDDLLHWEKSGKFVLPAPEGYDGNDWRDPYIFWDDESKQYIMILGARKLDGKKVRTGCTVWFTSKNLEAWEFQGDFWAPGTYSMHEMPDIFKIGDWWYLLTTEYSEKCKTVYRMSRSLKGPWIAPVDDAFDGRAYYAARSCSDGEHRYLFGWVPTKEGYNDMGNWHWGGTLVAHEVYQRPDGTLGVKISDTMSNSFAEKKELLEESICMKSVDCMAESCITKTNEDLFKLEARIKFTKEARMFGVRLYEDEATGDAYRFEFSIKENRLTFDRTPNQPWYRYMDKGLERPITLLPDKEYKLTLIVDDTLATIYMDGVAMSTRMYAKSGDGIVFYVIDGGLEVIEASLSTGQRG